MSWNAFSKCLADLILPKTNADAAQSASYRLGSAAVCGCSAYTCMHGHKGWQQPAHTSESQSQSLLSQQAESAESRVRVMHQSQRPYAPCLRTVSGSCLTPDSSMACSEICPGKCSRLSQGKMHEGAADEMLQFMEAEHNQTRACKM